MITTYFVLALVFGDGSRPVILYETPHYETCARNANLLQPAAQIYARCIEMKVKS